MRFVQLKQAERRSRFLKNERFFTFFKKSAEQSAAAIAPCLPRCPERVVHPYSQSFIHILAHSTAFSLIFSRRFSIFLTKNALLVFLCYFMLIFQPAAGMRDVNYVQLSLFEPLFSASWHFSGSFSALQRRFGALQRGFKGLADVYSCS